MSRPSKKQKTESDSRLEFAKTLHNLIGTQEKFTKSVETLQGFTKDELVNLDLKMSTKRQELRELAESIDIDRKNKRIETDQMLAEYRREGAIKILAENNEVPILRMELERLKNQVETLSKDNKEEIERAVADATTKGKVALKSATHNLEMAHKANVAELNATVNQQVKEIETLHKTLENMKTEIAEQRKLTMQVAQAGAKGSINQQFGKQ